FFDVLYNALKEDFSLPRVKAFLKRILQVAIHAEPPFAISSILLVAKLLQAHPGALSLLKFSDNNKYTNEGEEEVFRDVPDPDDEIFSSKDEGKNQMKPKENALLPTKEEQEDQKRSFEYDYYKREPLYANADNALLYELLIFKEHYHPTVKLYANG